MISMSANEIISKLDLVPHPEGGHFRETWRDQATVDGRSVGTAILFLLQSGEVSHWHRVDAAEIWHFHAGSPLELSIAAAKGSPLLTKTLGTSVTEGQHPQLVVPANFWQSARSKGDWTLVGCTVAPGFEFSRFELAEPGWKP